MQTINLHLDDKTYLAILSDAEIHGKSPELVITDLIHRTYEDSLALKQSAQEARMRFERHFGEVDTMESLGADNESIDADLAKAYLDPHE